MISYYLCYNFDYEGICVDRMVELLSRVSRYGHKDIVELILSHPDIDVNVQAKVSESD